MTDIMKKQKKYSSGNPVCVITTESGDVTYPIETTPIPRPDDDNDNQGNGQGQDGQGER